KDFERAIGTRLDHRLTVILFAVMREDLAQRIAGAFPFLTERPSVDYPAFNCPADQLLGLVGALKEQWQFDLLVDVTAIDNGEEADPRFTAVYHLYSIEHSDYVRLAADCVGNEEPRI